MIVVAASSPLIVMSLLMLGRPLAPFVKLSIDVGEGIGARSKIRSCRHRLCICLVDRSTACNVLDEILKQRNGSGTDERKSKKR
jgi:hypothetical protein